MSCAMSSHPLENQLRIARQMLKCHHGFSDCPPHLLDVMVAAGQVRMHAKGEAIGVYGDACRYLGLLIAGNVESTRTFGDGSAYLLGLVLPGQLFNVMEVVDGVGQNSDLVARTECTVLRVPADLVRLQQSELHLGGHILACALARVLAAHLRLASARAAVNPTMPLESRVATHLRILDSVYGHRVAAGGLREVKFSQEDLASLIGISRQRLNFILKKLEAKGVIQLRYAAIVIADTAALARIAEGLAKATAPRAMLDTRRAEVNGFSWHQPVSLQFC